MKVKGNVMELKAKIQSIQFASILDRMVDEIFKAGFDQGWSVGRAEGFKEGSAELREMRAKIRKKYRLDETYVLMEKAEKDVRVRLGLDDER